MSKLISFVIFVIAFSTTWFLFHKQSKIDVSIHASLQSKLGLMIEETIKTSRPKSYDFQILSLYTKKIDDNKINAYFSYRFSEKMEEKESSTQVINGEAMLNRTLSENPDDQKWVVQSVKTSNSSIEFQEGTIIGSGGDPANTSTPAQDNKPEEPKPEEKKTE